MNQSSPHYQPSLAVTTSFVEQPKQAPQEHLVKALRGSAHDINNVFTSIVAMSELALMEQGVTKEVRSALTSIKSYVERGNLITEQISKYAHSFKCNPKNIAITPFLIKFKANINCKLPINHTLKIIPPHNIDALYGDEDQLSNALEALVLNSSEALLSRNNNSESITIMVENKNDNQIKLSVEDNAGGLEEEVENKASIPFFSRKLGTNHPGLGLSIAQQIAISHQGHLEIDNRAPNGCKVNLIIPIINKSI